VRGVGAFWAVELVADKTTREPLATYPGSSPQVAAVVAACKKRGLLPLAVVNRIHLVPPLTASASQVHEAVDVLGEALAEARAG
jgi:taurine--2-oxoglutarate transaminase